ncbi:MAG: META domain-containing protein [Syntrophaceae bacterium]
MKYHATILLISAVIIAALFAGCTTQPQTAPSTPVATTLPATSTSPPSIFGTWSMVSTYSGGRAVSALSGTTITATFSEAGTVSGSAGCNNYVATCQITGKNMAIGKPAKGTTNCGSPTGVMDQETMYLSNLQSASTYAIEGDALTLYDLNGNILITFQRSTTTVSPLPIAGIIWNLDRYRQASGSEIPVIQDTEVTALFGPIGTINGTAGCNSYNGAYATSGTNGISIGPLATTLMYCGEPGVMDQETAYLTLLRTVASYEVTGDGVLNLKDMNGTAVLVYSS